MRTIERTADGNVVNKATAQAFHFALEKYQAFRRELVIEDVKLEFTEGHVLSYTLTEKMMDSGKAWSTKYGALMNRLTTITSKRRFRE